MRTARGFNEEFGPEDHHGDPVDSRTVGFDYPDEGDPEPGDSHDYALMANAIARLFGGLVDGDVAKGFDQTVGRRVIAMIWVVNPELFAMDEAPSLAQLAARLGISRAALSAYAAQFSRQFGLRNRSQAAHGWAHKDEVARESTNGHEAPAFVQDLLL